MNNIFYIADFKAFKVRKLSTLPITQNTTTGLWGFPGSVDYKDERAAGIARARHIKKLFYLRMEFVPVVNQLQKAVSTAEWSMADNHDPKMVLQDLLLAIREALTHDLC
jgi:hypothetical protein